MARRAATLISSGDVEGAGRLLEPARNDPEASPAMRSLLASVDLARGRPGPALALLVPLAERADAPLGVVLRAAEAAHELGRIDQALGFLARAARMAPGSEARRAYGLLCAQAGRYVEALTELGPWLEHNPDDHEARVVAALSAVELARAPQAEAWLDGLAPEVSGDPGVALLRAKIAMLRGQPGDALALVLPWLGRVPPSLARDGRSVVAEAYVQLGKSAEAVRLLEGRTEGDPWLTQLLARAHLRTGQAERTIELLEPLLGPDQVAAGSEDGTLYLTLGSALLDVGRVEASVTMLERATVHLPDDREAWQHFGRALVVAGRRDEGLRALERFRALSEAEGAASGYQDRVAREVEDPTARVLREADASARAGDVEAALEVLVRESALAPRDPRPWLLRLWLLTERGRMADVQSLVSSRPEPFTCSGAAGQQIDFDLAGRSTATLREAGHADLARSVEALLNPCRR